MSPVALFELLLLLIAAVIGLELLARRLHLPPAATLILGGIGLALIPGMPPLELDPDLALVLFLPPLLLSSAFFTAWRDFRAGLSIILQLAIGTVAFTTLVVGVVAHWVAPDLPWAACFALGAIVSPPDAVAAKAVLQRLHLPRRMTVLLEGESLVNDASGLVLYRFAVAAALTGTFSAQHALLTFGVLATVGVATGIAAGLVLSWLVARLKVPHLNILGGFLGAWGSYIGAEAIGASGVLSTVACGLVLGWHQHTVLSATIRTQAKAVWATVVFVLESLVFILIGLSLRGVLQRLGGDWHATVTLLPGAGAIIVAVVLSRFAWIMPAAYIRRLWPAERQRGPRLPLAIPIVMSWAGMRGVVSLAAALALPDNFPGRDFILATTFAVILVTVLLQGATLAPLIRALRLPVGAGVSERTMDEDQARARMALAQLATVENLSLAEDGSQMHPRLAEQFSYRARAATRYSEAHGALAEHRTAHFDVVLAAIAAGRQEVLRLHRTGAIHDTVLHALEQEMDIEELSARRRRGDAAVD
jgi:monovalent cation/hydrogen antiporter